MLKVYPLIEEKIAITTVKIINFTVPSIRSPDSLIVSTICPQSKGNKTNPPAEITSDKLATKRMSLFFHV